MKQVEKAHYDIQTYGFEGRFVSYHYQLKEVLQRKPSSILEIGVGDKVFGSFIKNNTDVTYTSVDIAEDLKPDIVASVTALPLEANSYSCVVAFEVLEHIPFEMFISSLGEMMRVASEYVIISLPHFGPPVQFLCKIPFLPKVQFSFKIPWSKVHVWNGQHYFEIGKKEYSTKVIRSLLEKVGDIEKDFVPFNSQYHHFYVLKKRKG
jgi:hypothetical protein